MMSLVITFHVIICILLIIIILIQAGRGSGLVDSFSGVESMFGTKTNTFLTRATTLLSILFFVSCLSLAVLSARQSHSLMKNIKSQSSKPPKEEIPVAVKQQEEKLPQKAQETELSSKEEPPKAE